jgi:hypothetical protein
MQYSKSELARIQLERAIELFLDEKDYISVITLAGASEEITRNILEREGKTPSVDKLKEWAEENHPSSEVHDRFYNHANRTRNNLKHFTNHEEVDVEVNETEAIFWLCRAVLNYDWSHAILTKPMLKYISWWKGQSA